MKADSTRAVSILIGARDQTSMTHEVVPSNPIGHPSTTSFRAGLPPGRPPDRVTYSYTIQNAIVRRNKRGALMDRGANGGILGPDARVVLEHGRQVDVTGIDNHELNALKIVDAVAKTDTHLGPVIIRLCQYAYHGINRTIHSVGKFL